MWDVGPVWAGEGAQASLVRGTAFLEALQEQEVQISRTTTFIFLTGVAPLHLYCSSCQA